MRSAAARALRVIGTAIERRPELSAALAGATVPLAFAPFSLYPLVLVSLLVLWRALAGRPPRSAALIGFLFGAAQFAAGTWWLYTSLHVFGKAPWLITFPLMALLFCIMGAYVAALGWLVARWAPADDLARAALLAGAWVILEWLRGWALSGFPWLSLGYSQIQGPLAGYAPVLGVYGVTLAVVFSLLCLVRLRDDLRWTAPLLACWLLGAVLYRVDWVTADLEPKTVALVQGNVSQDEKWDVTHLIPTMDRYWELSEPHWDVDIMVWPEAAVPALLHRYEDTFLAELATLANATDTALVMGALRREGELAGPERPRYYNSVIAVGQGSGVYDKRHLVPFGEYFPVPDRVREWLRLLSLPYSDFDTGIDDPPPLQLAGVPVAPSICYEDAFGAEQRSVAARSGMMVNVSNDAWFGTTIAPFQHLEIARMRALESGRPLIRATNTGLTVVTDQRGEVVARAPQFEPTVLRAEITPTRGRTPWLLGGNLPALLLALALCLPAVLRLRAASR